MDYKYMWHHMCWINKFFIITRGFKGIIANHGDGEAQQLMLNRI